MDPSGVWMDLRLDHRIPRTAARVEATLLDPAFASTLAGSCPALAEARVIDYSAQGDAVERVTWFRARPGWLGDLFGLLPAVSWIERVSWSRAAHAGRFVVAPELPAVLARRVRCDGTYALVPEADGSTLRRVEITLSIRAPVIAGAAEGRLAEMLRAVFDAEATLLGEAGR